jgi:hypothetical protein
MILRCANIIKSPQGSRKSEIQIRGFFPHHKAADYQVIHVGPVETMNGIKWGTYDGLSFYVKGGIDENLIAGFFFKCLQKFPHPGIFIFIYGLYPHRIVYMGNGR